MGQHGEGTGINSELCCEMLGASLIPLSHSFLVCKTERTVSASQDYDRSMREFTYLLGGAGRVSCQVNRMTPKSATLRVLIPP